MSEAEPPQISIESLSRALSDPARWQLILELAKGEATPVRELARRIRKSPDMTSHHLNMLREAGLVIKRYHGIYQIVPSLAPPPGATHMDLGWCQLKLLP